jgi:hypothetical protein
MFKFCTDASGQCFGIAKQTPTGGDFQQQAIMLSGNTDLAAVLVTPGSETLQVGLVRRLWKVQGQPLGRSLIVCICGHESSLSAMALHS